MDFDFCKIRQNEKLFFAKVLCSKSQLQSLAWFLSSEKGVLFCWLSSVFEKKLGNISQEILT